MKTRHGGGLESQNRDMNGQSRVFITKEYLIPDRACGAIIGKGGEIIRGVMQETRTRIKILIERRRNGDVPVSISGTLENVEEAKTRIYDLAEQFLTTFTKEFYATTAECSRIIGAGGCTRTEMKRRYNVSIFVDNNPAESVGGKKPVRILGEHKSVEQAYIAIMELLQPLQIETMSLSSNRHRERVNSTASLPSPRPRYYSDQGHYLQPQQPKNKGHYEQNNGQHQQASSLSPVSPEQLSPRSEDDDSGHHEGAVESESEPHEIINVHYPLDEYPPLPKQHNSTKNSKLSPAKLLNEQNDIVNDQNGYIEQDVERNSQRIMNMLTNNNNDNCSTNQNHSAHSDHSLRQATPTLGSTTSFTSLGMDRTDFVEKRFHVHFRDVGKIIGNRGSTVLGIRSRTHTNIYVSNKSEDRLDISRRFVRIIGLPEGVQEAFDEIMEIIHGEFC